MLHFFIMNDFCNCSTTKNHIERLRSTCIISTDNKVLLLFFILVKIAPQLKTTNVRICAHRKLDWQSKKPWYRGVESFIGFIAWITLLAELSNILAPNVFFLRGTMIPSSLNLELRSTKPQSSYTLWHNTIPNTLLFKKYTYEDSHMIENLINI